MSYTYCNQCGHRNPPESNFCSSCGEALDVLDDRTITLSAIDPLQDAPGNGDEVAIPVGELPRDRPVLIVRSGPQAGDRFTLDSDVTRLGRHPDSEISLDDITVSRRHAEVQRTAEGYMVADSVRSTAPTSTRSGSSGAALRHGDEVQIGKFRLVFFERTDA